MTDYGAASNDDIGLEQRAGQVVRELLNFAIRSASAHYGDPWALAALEEIEAGRARVRATFEVGAGASRIVCTLVPAGETKAPVPIAAMDLLQVSISH